MKESGRSRLGLLASAIVLAGISLLIFSLLPDQTISIDRDLPPPFAGWMTRSTGLSLLPPPTLLADSPALTFASQPYRHPSGAFGVRYPDGWQIDEAEDAAGPLAPEGLEGRGRDAGDGDLTAEAVEGEKESGIEEALPEFRYAEGGAERLLH